MTEHPIRPTYVSLTDAAAYLTVSTTTVRRMIAHGTIRGYRLGTRIIRVRLDDLDNAGRHDPSEAWWD